MQGFTPSRQGAKNKSQAGGNMGAKENYVSALAENPSILGRCKTQDFTPRRQGAKNKGQKDDSGQWTVRSQLSAISSKQRGWLKLGIAAWGRKRAFAWFRMPTASMGMATD